MNPPGLGFICCLVLGIVLLCPAIALLLPSAGLVALLAGMWLELLVKRNMHVAGLWIAMREMPSTAEIATVYPKLSAAFAPTLVGGLLSRCLVVIHDLVRLGATFGYEIVHKHSVYPCIQICRDRRSGVFLLVCIGIRKGLPGDPLWNPVGEDPRGSTGADESPETKKVGFPGASAPRETPPGMFAAACYSPTPCRVQYHHRARP